MIKRIFVVLAIGALFPAIADAQWIACSGGSATCTTNSVGVGTTTPSQSLEVNGNVRVTPATGSFSVGGAAPAGYQFFSLTAAQGVASGFQMRSSYSSTPATTYVANFGNYGSFFSQNREPQLGSFVNSAAAPNQGNAAHIVIGNTILGRLFYVANFPGGTEAVRLFIAYDGKVGIGTTTPTELLEVNGSIKITGNINAKYQDIAEWVESSAKMEPGTVVVLDPKRVDEVIPSSTAYDTSAAGVVSAQPGISLGEASQSKVQVATSGRVRVKVDATNGPIRIGDLLVTSNTPGMAMKSVPVQVSGVNMHRPGTLIGKALEPLERGQGEILVLLSMQ